MDYKKIFKNPEIRYKILSLFNWVPDKIMVKIQYRIKTGRKLNLKNPRRFTEKLQWYKLYYRNPIMRQCVDKYEVRKYVESKGLGKILNKLYGVYDNIEEINFADLPQKFVLKTNNGGGSQNVVLCENKDEIDLLDLNRKLILRKIKKSYGREWCYQGITPKIVCEELLIDKKSNDLADYKFFCFNGKVGLFYVRSGYVRNHEKGKMTFYNAEKEIIKDVSLDYCSQTNSPRSLPDNIDEMIIVAEKLSEDFPHVRVDLYNVNGKIYFGELTFFNASGYMRFEPDGFDYELGKKMKLRSFKNNEI